jgi:hypothetical protein
LGILSTFSGVREMAELDVALANWLKPFVEKLGHKKQTAIASSGSHNRMSPLAT